MKKSPDIIYQSGFAIPARCIDCVPLQRIVTAALEKMQPHRDAQAELMSGVGLVDVSTGTLWVSPHAESPLPKEVAGFGVAIKNIIFTAQYDINNLSRNCPGNGTQA